MQVDVEQEVAQELGSLAAQFDALENAWPILKRRFFGSVPLEVVRGAVQGTCQKPFGLDQLRVMLYIFPETCEAHVEGLGRQVFLRAHRAGGDHALRRESFRRNLRAFCQSIPEEQFRNVTVGQAAKFERVACILAGAVENETNALPVLEAKDGKSVVFPITEEENLISNKRKRQADDYGLKENLKQVNNMLVVDETSIKRAKCASGLRGLPASLIRTVHERQQLEKQLDPDAILDRLREQARASLSSFLDMLYLFFRQRGTNKMELSRLVSSILERRGSCAYPAVASSAVKERLVKEQIEMLTQFVPEWCHFAPCRFQDGGVLFYVDVSDSVNLKVLRAKLRPRSL